MGFIWYAPSYFIRSHFGLMLLPECYFRFFLLNDEALPFVIRVLLTKDLFMAWVHLHGEALRNHACLDAKIVIV